MKIYILNDDSIAVDLERIARGASRIAPELQVIKGTTPISIQGPVTWSESYEGLPAGLERECEDASRIVIFTDKPYDNNYFWESMAKTVIVSLNHWQHLTSLPRNNGAVYFCCAIAIRSMGIGPAHDENTGCINDFWWDKTGIDAGMRSAFVCPVCLRRATRHFTAGEGRILTQLQAILNDVGLASRAGIDICEYWSARVLTDGYDVFLCHNSREKEAVRTLNTRLQAKGVRTWFDEEQIPPGRLWQEELEKHIAEVKTVAVVVGESGIGPWQNMEIRAFLDEFVQRHCPVIPVLLSECAAVPQLPMFLRHFTWVDFRKKRPDPLGQLIWGITGRRLK